MGIEQNITYAKFPKQGRVGDPVSVCFHYDTSKRIQGEIVRDDRESPWITIIKLEDGRHVLATECQYRYL